MDTFFETIDVNIKTPVILLIDASGSVLSNFGTSNVFDKMESIVSNINADLFRIIFWNSNTAENKVFGNGLLKLPHVVEKKAIKQPFFLAKSKITNTCLTFPHLGFDNIPNEWINNKEATHIYFVTDGQIGYQNCDILPKLKNKLAESIKNLFKNYNNVHLHIISVEAKNMDYNNYEVLNVAAGGDVYKVIQNNNLTKYITEFISYSLNNPNGYHHINTIIPPPGFVPFGNKIFSEMKTNQFVKYLSDLIQTNKDSENELLKIIQNLSGSIRVLTKGKSQNIVENVMKMFCQMFNSTCMDASIVQFILADSVKLENDGKAIVLSEYKSKLANLYKEAQQLLSKNGKNAMSLGNEFMSLPINNKIISGHQNLVTDSYKYKKNTIQESAITVQNNVIPVLPMDYIGKTPMNEQCIRQFTRLAIAGSFNKINFMDDIVIYTVMGIMTRCVASDLPEKYVTGYRKLTETMLKKKYNNTEVTVLERLESGELPLSNNGKIENFYGYMKKIKDMLGLTINNMSMWYVLCLALGNNAITAKQYIHCSDELEKDFGQNKNVWNLVKSQINKLQVFEIPMSYIYDYKCIVTLDDTTNVGGYIIKSHKNISNSTCSPIFVLSETGHKMMIEQSTCFCPICYTNLNFNNFEYVGPKSAIDMNIF